MSLRDIREPAWDEVGALFDPEEPDEREEPSQEERDDHGE